MTLQSAKSDLEWLRLGSHVSEMTYRDAFLGLYLGKVSLPLSEGFPDFPLVFGFPQLAELKEPLDQLFVPMYYYRVAGRDAEQYMEF